MMDALVQLTLLVMLFMIYFVGRWLYSEIERRHAWEDHNDRERAQIKADIKADAERVARETAALKKILQQFPAVKEDRRLHSVRDFRR